MHIQVFTLLLLVTCASGVTTQGRIEQEINKWGTVTSFCTYKGVKFLTGSSFMTPNCQKCLCTEGGLYCRGFGYLARKTEAPEGCKIVNDACQPRMVDAEDELKDCETP